MVVVVVVVEGRIWCSAATALVIVVLADPVDGSSVSIAFELTCGARGGGGGGSGGSGGGSSRCGRSWLALLYGDGERFENVLPRKHLSWGPHLEPLQQQNSSREHVFADRNEQRLELLVTPDNVGLSKRFCIVFVIGGEATWWWRAVARLREVTKWCGGRASVYYSRRVVVSLRVPREPRHAGIDNKTCLPENTVPLTLPLARANEDSAATLRVTFTILALSGEHRVSLTSSQ